MFACLTLFRARQCVECCGCRGVDSRAPRALCACVALVGGRVASDEVRVAWPSAHASCALCGRRTPSDERSFLCVFNCASVMDFFERWKPKGLLLLFGHEDGGKDF